MGNLYGTTNNGGATAGDAASPFFGYGSGTVFELSPPSGKSTQWSERVLWSFGATSDDGTFPEAGLVADKEGNLYGTTSQGGSGGSAFIAGGTVFELSPPVGQSTQWSERVLYSFLPLTIDFELTGDGGGPSTGLIFDKWGNLYGTTAFGGDAAFAEGTVFELSPPAGQQTPWSERLLWSFVDLTGPGGDGPLTGDGQGPSGSLIFDKSGNLYGTTSFGGAFGRNPGGTVFELSPPTGQQTPWNERLLWSFNPDPDSDGYDPNTSLIFDKSGNLYGTTSLGGANCLVCGTVFKLSLP